MAAATTSLPETPGRRAQLGLPLHLDPRLHVRALGPVHARLRLGGQRLLLLHRRRGRGGGGPAPDHVRDRRRVRARRRRRSTTSRGYEGARPVRVGNGAYNQEQHDVWGAVLDSVYLHTKSRDHLPERIWPILVKQVEDAIEHWREPDRGIWEVRGEPKHFTSSKMMCWVALDRGARLAEIREDQERAEEWQAVADEIKEDICANALDDRGVFCQHYDTDELDASVLLMPLVRFLPADDERIKADGAGDRRRAHRGRAGAALPRRGDRRRPVRRGGHVHDLLVLAGVRARGDRRAHPGPRAVREAALLRRRRSSSTPRRSTRAPAGTSATSRRPSPTWR